MRIQKISEILNARIICGESNLNYDVTVGFSSDLMSDVLTVHVDNKAILLTGLCNIQTIRTAEMSDISIIAFVRSKKVTTDMIALAEENDMVLMETDYSMFKATGILYSNGITPVY